MLTYWFYIIFFQLTIFFQNHVDFLKYVTTELVISEILKKNLEKPKFEQKLLKEEIYPKPVATLKYFFKNKTSNILTLTGTGFVLAMRKGKGAAVTSGRNCLFKI